MRRRQTGNDRAIEASQDRSPSADRDSIRLGLVVILMALSAVVVIAGWQAAQLHAAAELQPVVPQSVPVPELVGSGARRPLQARPGEGLA